MVCTAALLAFALLCIPRLWPPSGALFLVEAGALMALEIIGASLSWQMHAVWLLVPLGGLLIVVLEDARTPWWLTPLLGLAALGFLSGPYEIPFEYGRFATGWLTPLISHTLGAALLTFALCLYVSRRGAMAETYVESSREPAPSVAAAHPAGSAPQGLPVAHG
jgi:hypothetical protein